MRESKQYAGRKYFFNPTTNETTWERPKVDPGDGLDPNVIARIEIVYNPKFGKYDAQKLCAQLLAVVQQQCWWVQLFVFAWVRG